jgi:hypothetical protein
MNSDSSFYAGMWFGMFLGAALVGIVVTVFR